MTAIRPRATTGLLAGLLALLWLAATALPASAHAALVETDPSDGQTVETGPAEVSWTFNEAVTSTSGALRVFDAAGERVDTGEQAHPEPERLTLALRDDLGEGSYVATHRVTSADGHVIRGALVFQVGDGESLDDDTLAALFSGGGDGVVALLAGIVRAVAHTGAFVLGGALLWTVAIARPGREDEQAVGRRWARRGAIAAVVAAVLVVPLQAMLTSGLGLGVLVNGRVLSDTLASSVGVGALARLVLGVVVLVLLARGVAARLPALAVSTLLLLSFLVDGHTRTADPAWLLVVGDAVHVLAGAAWFGGLVVLAAVVRTRRREDDPVAAAEVVAGFSRVATWSLLAVVAAGSAMSWALVRQPRALVDTEYGWTLLAKVALVAVVVLVAAYNSRRLVPAVVAAAAPAGGATAADTDATTSTATDPDRRLARVGSLAWQRLGRTVRVEVGLLVAVLAVTAFLVNLRPAAEEAGISGAFDTLVAVPETDLQLNLVVDPNRVGHNEIHFYVLDRTGRPVSELDSVQVRLTQLERDIGPIVREPFVAGPGHWQLDGNDLGVPGEWLVELVVGVDRFTEATVAVPVVVNP